MFVVVGDKVGIDVIWGLLDCWKLVDGGGRNLLFKGLGSLGKFFWIDLYDVLEFVMDVMCLEWFICCVKFFMFLLDKLMLDVDVWLWFLFGLDKMLVGDEGVWMWFFCIYEGEFFIFELYRFLGFRIGELVVDSDLISDFLEL